MSHSPETDVFLQGPETHSLTFSWAPGSLACLLRLALEASQFVSIRCWLVQKGLIGHEKDRKGDEKRRRALHAEWLAEKEEQQVQEILQGVRHGFRRRKGPAFLQDDVSSLTHPEKFKDQIGSMCIRCFLKVHQKLFLYMAGVELLQAFAMIAALTGEAARKLLLGGYERSK